MKIRRWTALTGACLLLLAGVAIRQELQLRQTRQVHAELQQTARESLTRKTTDRRTAAGGVDGPAGESLIRPEVLAAARRRYDRLVQDTPYLTEAFGSESAIAVAAFLESCDHLTKAEFIALAIGDWDAGFESSSLVMFALAVKLDPSLAFEKMNARLVEEAGKHLFPIFYQAEPEEAMRWLEQNKRYVGSLPYQQLALLSLEHDRAEGKRAFLAAGGSPFVLESYLDAMGLGQAGPLITAEDVVGIQDQETRLELTQKLISGRFKEDSFGQLSGMVESVYPQLGEERDRAFNWALWQTIGSADEADAMLDLSHDRSRSAFGITDQWAREDRFLDDAAAWIRSLPEGEARVAARRGFLQRIGQRDEELAREWERRLD